MYWVNENKIVLEWALAIWEASVFAHTRTYLFGFIVCSRSVHIHIWARLICLCSAKCQGKKNNNPSKNVREMENSFIVSNIDGRTTGWIGQCFGLIIHCTLKRKHSKYTLSRFHSNIRPERAITGHHVRRENWYIIQTRWVCVCESCNNSARNRHINILNK